MKLIGHCEKGIRVEMAGAQCACGGVTAARGCRRGLERGDLAGLVVSPEDARRLLFADGRRAFFERLKAKG